MLNYWIFQLSKLLKVFLLINYNADMKMYNIFIRKIFNPLTCDLGVNSLIEWTLKRHQGIPNRHTSKFIWKKKHNALLYNNYKISTMKFLPSFFRYPIAATEKNHGDRFHLDSFESEREETGGFFTLHTLLVPLKRIFSRIKCIFKHRKFALDTPQMRRLLREFSSRQTSNIYLFIQQARSPSRRRETCW